MPGSNPPRSGRMLPLAMAVVNGDSVGLNARTYGSSEVSETLNDKSAFSSGVSSTRPRPDTARRGEAASSATVIISPLTLIVPPTWPMPSSPMNRSRTVARTS